MSLQTRTIKRETILPCGCTKKWLKLPDELSRKLGLKITKLCGNGHYMYPYFVHDEDGDYFAPSDICDDEADGKYLYYCITCKNILN